MSHERAIATIQTSAGQDHILWQRTAKVFVRICIRKLLPKIAKQHLALYSGSLYSACCARSSSSLRCGIMETLLKCIYPCGSLQKIPNKAKCCPLEVCCRISFAAMQRFLLLHSPILKVLCMSTLPPQTPSRSVTNSHYTHYTFISLSLRIQIETRICARPLQCLIPP